MSGEASVTPMMSPVSCWGKKPLGTMTKSTPVDARVASITRSVMNWWSSTTLRPRS